MSYRRKSVVGDLHQFSLECEETGRELGQGSYATVMELTYKGLKCAGKNIHRVLYRQLKDDLVVRFSEECKLISELRHPNIVQFLGVHFESDNTPILVLEYIPITLSLCLEQNGTMPEEISYSILTDVVLGLRYLHEQDPPIIHRDLSANNILLTENLTAKISDLGVAKIVNVPISCVSRLTSVPGTPCYMPPEALVPTPKYNISIDIFSYGVLIIHIFSGQWPLPTEANILDPNHPNRLIPVSEADRRLLYLDRMGESHPMVTLIRSCLNNNSMLRPKAVEIWKSMLEASADRKPSLRTKLEVLLSLMEEPDAKGGRSEIRDVGSKRTGSVRQAGSSGGKIKAAQKMTGKPNGEEMLSRLQQNTTTAAKPQLQQEVEKPWQEVEPSNEGRQTLSKTAERSRADELISKFQSKKTSPVPAEKPAANTNKSWRDGNASQQFREEKPPTAQEGLSKPWEKAAAQRQDVNGKSPKKLWGDASNEKKNWRDERGGSQKRGGPNKSWRDGPPNENSQREGLNRIWGATSQHESAPKEGLNQTEKQQRDEQAPPRKKISDNWLSKAAASSTENTVTRDRPPPQKLTHNPTNLSQHQQPSDTQAAKAVVAKKKMATALYDFQSRTSEELSISKGELIEILEEGEDTAQGQWLLVWRGEGKKEGKGGRKEGGGGGEGRRGGGRRGGREGGGRGEEEGEGKEGGGKEGGREGGGGEGGERRGRWEEEKEGGREGGGEGKREGGGRKGEGKEGGKERGKEGGKEKGEGRGGGEGGEGER